MNEEYKDITPEKIEDVMKELGIDKRMPSIEHYIQEKDRKKYSAWKIDTGTSISYTGDAGIEMFNKAIKEYINNI